MEIFFSKSYLLFSLILSFIGGSSYIKLSDSYLNYNYQTGETAPIYHYLNVQNIGIQRARFDITSKSSWIFASREGQAIASTVELTPTSAVNFLLEIHPERLGDGLYRGYVSIEAVSLVDNLVLEKKEVEITLNKNLKLVVTPVPAVTGVITPSPVTPTPAVTIPPVKVILTPTPIPINIPKSQAEPTKFGVPTESSKTTPRPVEQKLPDTTLKPMVTDLTLPVMARDKDSKNIFKKAWHFFRSWLF